MFALVAAACGVEDAPGTSSADVPTATSPGASTSTDEPEPVVLLSGSFEVPAADGFGDPGFHEPFTLTGTVPGSAAGMTGEVVVRLFDAGRPDQACDRDHPLSGCTTIDWSDFENRPGVPDGGVFDNRLTLASSSGPIDLYLSEGRGLAPTPDQYSPT